MDCIICLDVGGTTIKLGKFINNQLVFKESYKTDIKNSVINQIIELIKNNIKDDHLIGIGIGAPGPVIDGVVLRAQNIKWERVELRKILENTFPKVLVQVLNDANAATLGEWYYGSSKVVSNFVLVTLGTGIGGGIVINSTLLEGCNGSSGEVGHIKIDPFKGRYCSCGLRGCIEQYASATGILKTARNLIKKYKSNEVEPFLKKYNTKDIFEHAKMGNEFALKVVDETSYYLAIALANITNILNPDKIVVGGGVSNAGVFFLDNIKKHYKDLVFYASVDTLIELATLSNDAGVYGCLYKVLEGIKK